MRKTAADAVKQHNAEAMIVPDWVWTKRFAHPRMENAAGSGRITFEYQEAVKGGHPGQTEPQHKTITTTEAYAEIGRLKRRIRRAIRKRMKETI